MKSALFLLALLPTTVFAETLTPEVIYNNTCYSKGQETVETLGTRATLPVDFNTQLMNQCACYAIQLKEQKQEDLMIKANDIATFNHLTHTYVETDDMTNACGKPVIYTGTDVLPEGIFTETCTRETLSSMVSKGIPLPAGGKEKISSQCMCYAHELKLRGESAQMALIAETSSTNLAYQTLRENYIDNGMLDPACGSAFNKVYTPSPAPVESVQAAPIFAAPVTPPRVTLPKGATKQTADLADSWKGRSIRVSREHIPGEMPSKICYDWQNISNCSAVQKAPDGTTLSSESSECLIGGYTQEETVEDRPKGSFILVLVAGGKDLELVLAKKPSTTDTTFTDIYGRMTVDIYNYPSCRRSRP